MGNQEWAIKNGQSRMGNQEWAIKNRQSRMDNQEWTTLCTHQTKTNKTKNTTQYVLDTTTHKQTQIK